MHERLNLPREHTVMTTSEYGDWYVGTNGCGVDANRNSLRETTEGSA